VAPVAQAVDTGPQRARSAGEVVHREADGAEWWREIGAVAFRRSGTVGPQCATPHSTWRRTPGLSMIAHELDEVEQRPVGIGCEEDRPALGPVGAHTVTGGWTNSTPTFVSSVYSRSASAVRIENRHRPGLCRSMVARPVGHQVLVRVGRTRMVTG
jgi:hypothetical protein